MMFMTFFTVKRPENQASKDARQRRLSDERALISQVSSKKLKEKKVSDI